MEKTKAKKKNVLKDKEFWIEFLKATCVVIMVACTIGITWGIPQLASWGQSNFPSIPLDDKIPLITEFVWVYYLTFPLGIATVYIMYFKNREVMWEIVTAFMCACFISMLFYFIYPTEMVKPSLDAVTWSDKMTINTWNACRPVCCLPSQHCFMALSCIFGSIFEKKTHWSIRIFTAISGVLIILSTVFIKQHYVLDFVASFVIIVPTFIVCRCIKWGKSCDNVFEKVVAKTTAKFKKPVLINGEKLQENVSEIAQISTSEQVVESSNEQVVENLDEIETKESQSESNSSQDDKALNDK